MSAISYDLRQTYLGDFKNSSKMLTFSPKIFLLSQDRFLSRTFLKNRKQSPHFNACHPVQLSEQISRTHLKQVLILAPKMTHLPHFGNNGDFSQKENDQLYQLLNNCQKCNFRKI